MKAVVKNKLGAGAVTLTDWPEPAPGPRQVKVKVRAAGVCGSDIHIWHGTIKIPMEPPVVIGHEFSGEVAEVGAGVEGIEVGARITSETTFSTCGRCLFCLSGRYNLCVERRGIGYWYDGAFTDYVVVPAERVHPLPDAISFREGAMCEPLACTVRACELTSIRAGDLVVVCGPGQIGLMATQLALADGARVVILGAAPDAARLELALQFGAHSAVDVSKQDPAGIVAELSNGRGADAVLECSGAAPAARMGLELVRRGGQYTQVGLFGQPIEIDFEQIAYKELEVRGSFSQRFTAWDRALRLLGAGKVDLKPLVSEVLTLENWEEAFRMHEAKKGLKILMEP